MHLLRMVVLFRKAHLTLLRPQEYTATGRLCYSVTIKRNYILNILVFIYPRARVVRRVCVCVKTCYLTKHAHVHAHKMMLHETTTRMTACIYRQKTQPQL